MSSRHEVRRPRSRDKSVERRREHIREISGSISQRSHSKDKHEKYRSESRSKHRSSSRDSKRKDKKKKSKKKKKKHSSSSESSCESSEEELKLLQRLEAERQRLAEEKRKQKEELKAKETPEEKRARRLREKQEKERRRRERMGWDGEYQCYTNQDNPFGDSALTNTFVWTKKLARDGVKQISRDELDAETRRKQLENKIELEKVKQRRLEREAERAAREAEAAAAARAREAAQFDSWARQEDAFHLQQARLRSQIRIRDGRAKPIDLLAYYVCAEGATAAEALDMHEPYTYLHGLGAQDLEDLLEDIKVYMELGNAESAAGVKSEEGAGEGAEAGEDAAEYWRDVHTIVGDELRKLKRERACRDPVHRSVASDVTQVFKGKTGAQLEALREQIAGRLRGAGAGGAAPGLDVGYWESLLSQLEAHMSRARLRERHQRNLRRKLRLLRREQGVAAGEESQQPSSSSPQPSSSAAPEEAAGEGEAAGAGEGGEPTEEDEAEEACVAAYIAGRYSPEPLSPRALEPGAALEPAADDERRLLLRRGVLRAPPAPAAPPALAAMESVARAGMGGDEAAFSVESALPAAPPPWADKYRPRKPRYFNRVHTGFEWNKYNQTHYDMDNPPPKIVQGYKFNIFYPDLVDKQATPSFSLKPCSCNAEFAELRFSAGPPYEDIAFKIVNREWEYSYKRGFRCHFHNNIFQLWFHFKRYRYRR